MSGLSAATRPKPASIAALLDLARADMAGVDALIRERMQSPVSVIPALAEHLIADAGKRLRPVGSSRVDLQACKLEYSIVSPK